MATKRTLKKHFAYVCGDLAAECIVSANLFKGADIDALQKIVMKIALLQDSCVKNVNIAFDKAPGDFENKAEYNRARNQYFSKAYASLLAHFNDNVKDIVAEMNQAVPRKKEA